jgi:hypothetical protein
MEGKMIRFSRYAVVALVASLAVSSGNWQKVSALANAGASDMDIRLLCHEQARQGWPCDDQEVRAALPSGAGASPRGQSAASSA